MYSKQRGGRYKLPGHQIWGFRRVLPPGGLELGTGGAEPFGPSSSRTLPPTHLGRLVFLILIIIDNFFFFSRIFANFLVQIGGKCLVLLSVPATCRTGGRGGDTRRRSEGIIPLSNSAEKPCGLGLGFRVCFFFSPQICCKCLCNNHFTLSTWHSVLTE